MAEFKAGMTVRTPDGFGSIESTYETEEGQFAVTAVEGFGTVSYPFEDLKVLVP